MRIAIITNTFPPRLGGLESHVAHLAYSLHDLGHEVWVLTISSAPGQRCEAGVHVLTGSSHLPIADVISFPRIGTTRRLARFLCAHNIDVVSVHTRFFPMTMVGLRAAHRANIPVIHTEHGSGFVTSDSPIIAAGSRTVDLTLGRYILRHADRVLAISDESARFVTSLSGVSPNVFYNAIPTPALRTTPHQDRPEHLLFVGRVVAGKGWDAFLRAVAALRARGHAITGELLGDGAQLPQARTLAASLGVDDVVALPGRVPPTHVRQALAGATLVNPTTLSEGFQTTLLEAMAEGGRIVTYEVPGACQLRDRGAPVRICPDRTLDSLIESIDAMLTDPLPPASEEIIKEWTWPVRAAQYAAIAEDVAARR